MAMTIEELTTNVWNRVHELMTQYESNPTDDTRIDTMGRVLGLVSYYDHRCKTLQ